MMNGLGADLRRTTALFCALTGALALGAAVHAGDLYRDEVIPILQKQCYGCHSDTAGKSKGGLKLDTADGLSRGGDGGSIINTADPDRSRLLVAVRYEDAELKMPPPGVGRERLTPEAVDVLVRWVRAGAAAGPAGPGRDIMASGAGMGAEPTSVGKDHWAYKRPVRPSVPMVHNARWPRNAIDSFILAGLENAGLGANPEADRRALTRRVYFDVIGLPPTPEELEEFLGDKRPDAYERLVDRLLASPHYGERWARHWLDVVRFAESHGFEMNQMRPNAWPFRDFVIQAFNTDKPYDQFVLEQLAGDVLGSDAATGFLVGGAWDQVKSPDPVLTAQQRADELNDMVSTTGTAFLGLTVGCAKCHSHKFDPIPQTDYYALAAVFAGVQHGERPIQSAVTPASRDRIEHLRTEHDALAQQLRAAQPVASTARVLALDDSMLLPSGGDTAGVGCVELAKPAGVAEHAAGSGRGEVSEDGAGLRLPNLGRAYHWWNPAPNQDLFAYVPRVQGKWRVWISWGCGWHTHATNAVYLIDRNGDASTTADCAQIARVDQRRFADGSGDPNPSPDRPLWSGFYDAGVHEFVPSSRLILRAGSSDAPTTADVVVFEQVPEPQVAAASPKPQLPSLRPAPRAGENVERFAPVAARFLRFEIGESSGGEPCLDEIEVFTAENQARNVALKANGARVAASGTLSGFAMHRLEHLNDGSYGNEKSWISNEPGRGWVQIEFAREETVDRVVWSRDRSPKPQFQDRVPTRYEVLVSQDGKAWTRVARSDDRLSYGFPNKVGDFLNPGRLGDARAASLAVTAGTRAREIERELARLTSVPVAYAGRFAAPEIMYRFQRGDPMQPREVVAPAGLSAVGARWQLSTNALDRERRLALGRWIVARDNPLTARVMVNRLWHYHFGKGLVETPSDLGVNGARPSHPELLDWLATEFQSRGWSLKAMHRLILTSATYRQSSEPRPDGLQADAQARLLWRFPPRRLEAEPLRDTILAVAGVLDTSMGGPGFDLFEPNDNYVKVYKPRGSFSQSEFRRMIYQTKPRVELDDVFGSFDCPDAGQITPRRTVSTTPLQALNLLNSPFMLQQSAYLAARLEREAGHDPVNQVRKAFKLAFGRDAAPFEIEASARLVKAHGLTAFCRAIFNANEFSHVF